MSSPTSIGRDAEKMHAVGDIYIQGSRRGGYSAIWGVGELIEAALDIGVCGGTPFSFGEALKMVSNILVRASEEWCSSNRLVGVNELLSLPYEGYESAVKSLLATASGLNATTIIDLPNDTKIAEVILSILSEDARNEAQLSKIIPVCLLDEKPAYSTLFTYPGNVGIPIFGRLTKPEELAHGVLGAITLNIPRAASKARNEDLFFDDVGRLMEAVAEIIESKKNFLYNALNHGELPVTSAIAGGLDKFAGSVGVVGVHEALQKLIGKGVDSKQGKAVAYKLLEYMTSRARELGDKTGIPFLIHALPVDGAAYKLAALDKDRHLEIQSQGANAPFYTSSTMLPAGYTNDLWDALEHQKRLQKMYTGGSIFNVQLERPVDDEKGLSLLAARIKTNFDIPLFSFSPVYSICRDHGYLGGRVALCPTCGKETTVHSRNEFSYAPENTMSPGELEEVRLRRPYAVASGW